jgi:hypothetical protein
MLLNLTQFTPDALMHLRTYHRQTKIILKFPFEVKLKSTTFIKMFLGSEGGGAVPHDRKTSSGPQYFPTLGNCAIFLFRVDSYSATQRTIYPGNGFPALDRLLKI